MRSPISTNMDKTQIDDTELKERMKAKSLKLHSNIHIRILYRVMPHSLICCSIKLTLLHTKSGLSGTKKNV